MSFLQMKNSRITFLLLLFFIVFTSFISNRSINPELVEFTSSECQEGIYYPNLSKLKDRILNISKEGNYHSYEIFVVANCGQASNGKIEIKNDTLNLKFEGAYTFVGYEEIVVNDSIKEVLEVYESEYTDCDCAFNLTYKIKNLKDKDYVILVNGKEVRKTKHKYKIRRSHPKFKIIGNQTVNLVDIYGLKQGLHIFERNDKFSSRVIYLDDEKISGVFIRRYENWKFDREETFMENKKYTKRKFYRNNKLIKECDTDGTFDEGTNCVFFD